MNKQEFEDLNIPFHIKEELYDLIENWLLDPRETSIYNLVGKLWNYIITNRERIIKSKKWDKK